MPKGGNFFYLGRQAKKCPHFHPESNRFHHLNAET